MSNRSIISFILVCLIGHACVESIDLKSIRHENMLVVEGHISNINKPQQIRLSRASALNEKTLTGESGADVVVENGAGEKMLFHEVRSGIYESVSFAGVVGETYNVHITTSNGRKYKSEQVVLKAVPPIGKISAEFVTSPERGIKISIDTEDPLNSTHYYRWDYVETYEVHTPYPSNYWVPPGTDSAVWRFDRVDHCWPSDTLREVLIRSTRTQDQDKVIAFPLRFIPEDSYIFRVKYSMLVQQYALSESAYNYWEITKTFNETQGSLADVQPGTIKSNIVGVTDPKETVLGYFDASAIDEKRVFFDYNDFKDAGYERPEFRSSCYELTPIYVVVTEIGPYMELHGNDYAIWDAIGFWPTGQLELFPLWCCDCSDMGPTVKPSFWED
jgi:hypothetical protein